MRACLDAHADMVEPALHLIGRRGLTHVDVAQVFRAADALFEHAHVVDRHDHFVRLVDLGDVTGATEEEVADAELVLAVGREVVIDDQPAARAERQAVDVLVLIACRSRVLRDVLGFWLVRPIAWRLTLRAALMY